MRQIFIAMLITMCCNACKSVDKTWDEKNTRNIDRSNTDFSTGTTLAQDSLYVFDSFFHDKHARNFDFVIKAEFKEGDNSEYMWVSVLSAEQDSFAGELNNVPLNLKNIKCSDIVRISRSDILDWSVLFKGDVVRGDYINKQVDK